MKFLNQNYMFVKQDISPYGGMGTHCGGHNPAYEKEAHNKRIQNLEKKIAMLEEKDKEKRNSNEVIF